MKIITNSEPKVGSPTRWICSGRSGAVFQSNWWSDCPPPGFQIRSAVS
jgi:hypothetical protein